MSIYTTNLSSKAWGDALNEVLNRDENGAHAYFIHGENYEIKILKPSDPGYGSNKKLSLQEIRTITQRAINIASIEESNQLKNLFRKIADVKNEKLTSYGSKLNLWKRIQFFLFCTGVGALAAIPLYFYLRMQFQKLNQQAQDLNALKLKVFLPPKGGRTPFPGLDNDVIPIICFHLLKESPGLKFQYKKNKHENYEHLFRLSLASKSAWLYAERMMFATICNSPLIPGISIMEVLRLNQADQLVEHFIRNQCRTLHRNDIKLLTAPKLHTIIDHCNNIKHIGLHSPRLLTAPIITKLNNLRVLSLTNQPNCPNALKDLGELKNIFTFSLDSRSTDSWDLEGLSNFLPNLRVLELAAKSIDDFGLSSIAKLNNLTHLNLITVSAENKNNLSENLAKIKKLQILILDTPRMTDQYLTKLYTCSCLRELTVPPHILTYAGLNSLSKIKSLQCLILPNYPITGGVPEAFRKEVLELFQSMPNLKAINFRNEIVRRSVYLKAKTNT